ncbi:MAG TPA: hypothetical protein VEZ90_05785, partial [Blastocatellia bacterium]|nr:hypothetical protein [Blastocatellia bacterium]
MLRSEQQFNLVLIDLAAPKSDSNSNSDHVNPLEVMQAAKANSPLSDTLLITGGDRRAGVEAIKAGAFDYIDKSVVAEELPLRIDQIAEVQRIKQFERKVSLLEGLGNIRREAKRGAKEDELLQLIVEGVNQLGFDRVRIYTLSDDHQFLTERARYGMRDAFEKVRWPISDCPRMQ